MKIVYCLNSIRGLGGIQRVTIVKANALAEIEGNEVYIVVSDNKNDTEVAKLSDKVHLVDLDINYYDGDRNRSKISNIIVYRRLRRKHHKVLEAFLNKLQPDIVISVGGFEKYMLLSMKNRTWKVIREFHFERNYRQKYSKTWFDRMIASASDFYDFHFKEKGYDRIILLTEEDKELNWNGWESIEVIPNPVSFKCDNPSPLTEKVVVYAGRLDPIKNVCSLVNSFKMVAERHPDWVLKIYGDGSDRELIKQHISELGLQENALLMGFSKNVMDVYYHSSITALSSRCEGFPMSLIEAVECGVPIVSYQCPCGPKDLISEHQDGFLVPLGDEKMMADRICTLIEDEEFRHQMGQAARVKAKNYHLENIIRRWMDLFNGLVKA